MQWLNDRLYEKEEIQNIWSIDEWRALWAQLVRVLDDGLSNITLQMVETCSDVRKKAVYKLVLQRKIAAEEEIVTWDLSKMSYKVKLLIKAQIMQRVKYKYALKTFKNLVELEAINAPEEIFDIRINNNTYKNLKAYYNLNIYV